MKQTQTKNYYEMTIVDHHREYPLPITRGVHTRIGWEGFESESIINDFISLFYPDRDKLTDNELSCVMKRACFTAPNILPDSIEPLYPEMNPNVTLYHVSGHINDLKRWAHQFANEIISVVAQVSGDDDYFDYFPTYHEMFYCVCRELDLRDLYNLTYESMMTIFRSDRPDYDDDPCISNYWTD